MNVLVVFALVPLLASAEGTASAAGCTQSVPGMRCIAAGPAAVGKDGGPKNETPARQIELSTFLIDEAAVSAADHQRCVDAKVCPPRKQAAADGAVVVDYADALKLCAWAGKRLPTEWEWEKAAGAAAFVVDGDAKALREWTATWAGEAPAAPCQQCSGKDPTGICSSTDPCSRGGAKKIVRGRTSSARQAMALTSKAHVRCAANDAPLTGFPTRQGTEVRPTPPPLAPPTDAQRTAAHAVVEDPLDKQTCEKKGRSFLDCRDPNSYVKTNEPRQSLWVPYIRNLGGGYTGVGIDQNYSLMAVQRAEWGWLFDYDPTVVRLHHVLRAIILDAADRAAFIAHFDDAGSAASLAAIEATFAEKTPRERAALSETYRVLRKTLAGYYRKQQAGEKDDPSYGWLASEEAYAYVRVMHQQGRIVILQGDMLGAKAMMAIGNAARAAGVVIRVYYPSNAPEFWPHSQQYKDNVIGLPFDARSVVVQTFSGLHPGYGEKKKGYWHYNVQAGLDQQSLMRRRGVGSLPQLVTVRSKTQDPDLTVTGLERASP